MATTAWRAKMVKTPKFSTRHRNRCQICGRARAVYRKFGGYQAWEKILREKTPREAIIEEVKAEVENLPAENLLWYWARGSIAARLSNPATGEPICSVAEGDRADVDLAADHGLHRRRVPAARAEAGGRLEVVVGIDAGLHQERRDLLGVELRVAEDLRVRLEGVDRRVRIARVKVERGRPDVAVHRRYVPFEYSGRVDLARSGALRQPQGT